MQVIKMSHEDQLYYSLLHDMATIILFKNITNCNLEFWKHMYGHMSPAYCYAINMTGEFFDFTIPFYALDITIVR